MAERVPDPPSATGQERRSNLRRLDDLLDALEALNLADAPALSAAVAVRLDELGIHASRSGAPFTELIDAVLQAQERYMVEVPAERRGQARRRPSMSLRIPRY